MAIPDFQSLMLPLLEAHRDGREHINRELVEELGRRFGLTDAERREMLPSGRAKLFDNRIGWAKTHVSRAGLIASPRRAVSVITDRGLDVLRQRPDRVDMRFLGQFDEYREAAGRKRSNELQEEPPTDPVESRTPEETLENAYAEARKQTESDILRLIMASSPEFLERVVVDLVVRMGYGGSRKDAGEALGRSGDEGIDGIIKEDPLGLDTIYLQAKRWDSTVGRPEIQKFAGALQGQRARKGIFITTSVFSSEAQEYVSRLDTKIILIDGARLAQLMFDHEVGVASEVTYKVKRIDSDYFSEP